MPTITVDEMIKQLKEIKKRYGNINIYVSADSEGNSFGTTYGVSVDNDEQVGIIYPFDDGLDFEDLV